MKKMFQRIFFVAATVAASSAMAAATFYETPDFGGQPLSVDGVIPDFRAYDYNDRAMSVVVEGAPVQVCWDINFGGNCQVFNPGYYRHLGVWSHQISSVRPAYNRGGYADRRHEHRHYEQRGYEQGGYEQRGYDQRDYDRREYDQQTRWRRNSWDYGPNETYRRSY